MEKERGKKRVFIGKAWPYGNGSLHLGHIAALLPADVLARYHRLVGNEVLFVSGTDSHGTPITVKAEQEGKTPEEIATHYHKEFKNNFRELGFSHDIYTTTMTDTHREVVQEIFTKLYEKGLIEKKKQDMQYCNNCERFLPDRYVEGTCPSCNYSSARGDQCDNCGELMDSLLLIKPKCKICSNTPEIRETEHFFLKLSTLEGDIAEWLDTQTGWRKNALKFSKGLVKKGLKDRAITRDLEWGIPIPIDGYENKRIYVWFEAVCGYLSASKEYSKNINDSDYWKIFWDKNRNVLAYYVHGKDNIPFHSIIWPTMLIGYENLKLPDRLVSSEYLTLDKEQFSTSRNWAVWVPDILKKYQADAIRYFLLANGPENSDSDFTWEKFANTINNELLATYGNLVHRVLSFTHRNFNGEIPTPSEISKEDLELIDKIKTKFNDVGTEIENANFIKALKKILDIARDGNKYMEEKKPWVSIKQNRQEAANTMYILLQIVRSLNVLMSPFLPFSSMQINSYLNENELAWEFKEVNPGTKLKQPVPIIRKVEIVLENAEK